MTFIDRAKAISIRNSQAADGVTIFQSKSAKLDETLRNLPQGQARAVKVPTSQAKSRAFLARLANANAARIAAGGVAMVLVLMHADSAQAQAATTSVSGIDGVASVAVRADGSALVTLDNGGTLVLPAGSFVQSANGEVLITAGTATQIMAAADGAAAADMSGAAIGGGVGLLAAIGAAAGGGSGGGSSVAETPTSSGRVVDGYLVGATVFRDLNDDGALQEAAEPNTTTDDLGNWTLDIDSANPDAKLISFGGTDISTGKPFTGVLTAPGGSTVVTPLTTLVQSYVESQAAAGNTVSAADAGTRLAKALGLEGQDLLTLDPIEAIEGEDGSANAFKAAAQVASVINAASAATNGGEEQAKNVASSIADKLLEAEETNPGNGTAVLSEKATIDAALTAGGVDAAKVSKIGDQLVTANGLIQKASAKDPVLVQQEVTKVQEVVQGDLVDAIQSDDDAALDDLNVQVKVEEIVPLAPQSDFASVTFGGPDIADGLVIAGTGRPGSTVQVTIDGVAKTAVVSAAVNGSTGEWSVTFAAADLPDTDGDFAVALRARPEGATAFTTPFTAGTLTVDVSVTDVVLNNIPTDPVLLADQIDGTTISGTTEANASVVVTLGAAELTVSADANGAFSAFFAGVTPAVAANGQNSVTVKAVATDTLGNVSGETTATIPLQPLSALTPTVDAVPAQVNAAEAVDGLTLTGTGLAGSVVTVTAVNGDTQFTDDATVAADGTWSVTVPAGSTLLTVPGAYTVSAVASLEDALTSASVNGGSITVEVPVADGPLIDPIAGDNVLDAIEAQSDLVVTGTAEANSTVTVALGDLQKTDEADANGAFSVTFTAAEIADLEGSATITAFSTDDQENDSATTSRAFTVTAPIAGTEGFDELSGTDGNDLFLLKTEGVTEASAGNDTYDFSDTEGAYQEIDYSGLDQGLDATINMNADTSSSVGKGTLGTDTLVKVDVPKDEGFGIITTDQDDTVDVVQNSTEFSFTGLYYTGGDDTYNIQLGEGTTRVSFLNATSVNSDLKAGTATAQTADGSGTAAINITPSATANASGRIELEGSEGDDVLLGSDSNDRFIGRGGNDSIDGRDGTDLIRFDRSQTGESGVFVSLSDNGGTALGLWKGEAFKHELFNIEQVRGSRGNDLLFADDGGFFLDGRDGNDTLVGDDGNDSFQGGAGADVFVTAGGFDYINDFTIGQDFLSDTDDLFGEDLNTDWDFFQNDAGLAVMEASGGSYGITFGGGVTADQLEAAFNAGTLFYTPPAPTNQITGTIEDETLTGTAAGDNITAVGRTDGEYGYDVIIGSEGFDTFDLSGLGQRDYIEFDYSGRTQNGIVGELAFRGEDGSEGTIWKMGGGFDRITDLAAAGDGVGVIGTAFNDDLFVVYDDSYRWVGVKHTGGHDQITIERDWDNGFVNGIFRASIGHDNGNVTGDLASGVLTSSSGGSLTLVTEDGTSAASGTSPALELRTYDGNDDVKGTDSNDRFILGGGNDTVDGRGGDDLVRYDRSEVSGGVTVDLESGTATGTWSGAAFTHSLTSIETIRGSAGNDSITGDSADNLFLGRNGNDTLDGGEGDDTLDGGNGDDRLTGGEGADLFILSSGHDVITDFDVFQDDIEDGNNVDSDGEPTFEEITFEGEVSTKVTFGTGGDRSLTLKGVDNATLEQWLIASEFGDIVTPAGLDDPIIVQVLNADFDGIDPFEGASVIDASNTQVVAGKLEGSSAYTVTFDGEGFVFTGEELTGGFVDSVTLAKDGVPSITLTNVKMSAPDLLDVIINDGTAARDVYMVGSDNAEQLGFAAQKVWIEGNNGDDMIQTFGTGDTSVYGGNGSDMIRIDQGGDAQTFIFIDPDDTGVDMIDGFRLSDSEDLGDRLIVIGGDDSNSHYYFGNANLDDEASLEAQLSNIGDFLGTDENVAFFTNFSDEGALYLLNDTGEGVVLGKKLAEFQNIDFSQFGEIPTFEFITGFAEEVPQLPEMA